MLFELHFLGAPVLQFAWAKTQVLDESDVHMVQAESYPLGFTLPVDPEVEEDDDDC